MWLTGAIAIAMISMPHLGSPVLAASKGDLEKFAGAWRGKGQVKLTKTGATEVVVCRTKGSTNNNGRYLAVQGRCGGGDFTGTFRLVIQVAKSGKYLGSISGTGQDGTAVIAGRKSGRRYRFEITSKGQGSGPIVVTTVSKDQFRLKAQGGETDMGKRIESVDILFKRR